MNATSTEPTFNQALASVLKEIIWYSGVNVYAEARNIIQGRQPDIFVELNHSLPIVIETSYLPEDANRDAESRLGLETNKDLEILSVISIHIPTKYRNFTDFEKIKTELKKGIVGDIRYAIYQLNKSEDSIFRFPNSGFIEGNVFDLVDIIPKSVVPSDRVDEFANIVADSIRSAASLLDSSTNLSRLSELEKVVEQYSPISIIKTSMVLWLNAFLVQHILSQKENHIADPIPLSRQDIRFEEVREWWKKITGTNWLNVFNPAVQTLNYIYEVNPENTHRALKTIIRCVREILRSHIGEYIHFGCELFPKISDNREESAAYYTQETTAEFLTRITIRENDLEEQEWLHPDFFKNHCMGDFACGTGTLIRSSFRRINQIRETMISKKALLDKECKKIDQLYFHQDALEQGLIGLDISPIAIHLTSASLVQLGNTYPYNNTRMSWVKMGTQNGYTGSIEYLQDTQDPNLFGYFQDKYGVAKEKELGDTREIERVEVDDSSVDWVIMNPPYSRATGGRTKGFDLAHIEENHRELCQTRWGRLIENAPAKKTSGMAAAFLVLGRNKCKTFGRMGFVLPLTFAMGNSWSDTRRMFELEFTNIIAITTEIEKAWGETSLSADTKLGEMLLVAQRKPQEPAYSKEKFNNGFENPQKIYCVTLSEPIMKQGIASIIADEIYQVIDENRESDFNRNLPIQVGDQKIGSLYTFKSLGQGSPWYPLGVKNGDLTRVANRLIQGYTDYDGESFEMNHSMTTIGNMVEVGIGNDLIGSLANSRSKRGGV
ncbi:MAG: hypothetical protein OXC92_09475 [Flavobacteriaceae bacterium]|nr:hypothetical protein [Flavobacteriaceae bacterium]MCY4253981.1 hypothetical protein [Flavobacteriaceae bacterium]